MNSRDNPNYYFRKAYQELLDIRKWLPKQAPETMEDYIKSIPEVLS